MGTSDSKASVAFRAFGKAFGFIGRVLTPSTYSLKWRRKKPEDNRVKRTLSQKDAIEFEIEKIEHRLDSIYRRIAQGASIVRQDTTGSGTAELDDLLKLTHDLKDSLRAKRIELSRLERQTARNVRFQISVSSKSDQDEEREERSEAKQNLPPKPTHIGPKLARAIQNAARKASFLDNSKKIIFENIVRDILEGDEELRRVAVSNLGDLKGSDARHILTLLLDDPDSRVCAAALNSLSVIGEPISPSVFRRFVDSREEYLRLAALRGLARSGKKQDAAIFINHLEDRHPAIRKAAATYLGWRKEKSGLRRLIRALYDSDDSVRSAAATALGQVRDDRAVMSLIRKLDDDSATVRKATKEAIEAILNEKIEFDTGLDTEDPKTQVEEIKDWWRKSRIDKQLEIRGAKPADSVALGEREVLSSVSTIAGEENRADGWQTRRTTTADAETDSKAPGGLREKASEQPGEPVEDTSYHTTDNGSKAVSTGILENPVDSDLVADKPLIDSVRPEVDKQDKDALPATDIIDRLVESGEAVETPQRETLEQAERISENNLDDVQPLLGDHDAFASSAQASPEEVNEPQIQNEIEEEKSEGALYQEEANQFDTLGKVAEAQETSNAEHGTTAAQTTDEHLIDDSKIESAATDNAETAGQAPEPQAAPSEDGVQDFGLDDLGIKVADENQESPAESDSNESSEEQKESESGDNEEYDFLLDS